MNIERKQMHDLTRQLLVLQKQIALTRQQEAALCWATNMQKNVMRQAMQSHFIKWVNFHT
jgi:hypothetical protein